LKIGHTPKGLVHLDHMRVVGSIRKKLRQTPLERREAKIRWLGQFFRGWTKNVSRAYKKEKKQLLDRQKDQIVTA
jgi:hypothetical protein